MILKRFVLPSIVFYAFHCHAGGISINVEETSAYFNGWTESANLVSKVEVGSKELKVIFEKTDSSFRNWKMSGNNFDGSANLFITKEKGVGWNIRSGDDSIKVSIARDIKNAKNPNLISMSTSFISGLFILENADAECNCYFRVYSLKNSWDADVEYVGKYAAEIESGESEGTGKWGAKTGKLKVPQKIIYMSIFVAVMNRNVNHLIQNLTL